MRTKLRRIEELLSKKKKQKETDGWTKLPDEIKDSFEHEIQKLSSENDFLKQ